MRRRTGILALPALLIATIVLSSAPPTLADSDSGAGPDENRDETTRTPMPARPAAAGPTDADDSSGGVTVLRVAATAIDDFRYDALMLKGRAGDVCAGNVLPGTLAAFYEVVDRFGGQAGTMYSCRERWDALNNPDCNGTVVNPTTNPSFTSTCWSNHALGRAFDVMVGRYSWGAYNRARGVNIVNWLIAADANGNPNANARKLGVQQILFADRCWNSDGDRGIASWDRARVCGIGHHDHVHVDMTKPGAAKRTSWWGFAPSIAPKLDTQVLWDRDSSWRQAVSWWHFSPRDEEGVALRRGPERAVAGDFGSDGFLDEIFLWDNDTGTYYVQNWAGGDGVTAVMGTLPTGYEVPLAGDWDRDGRVDDLIMWSPDDGRWRMQSWSTGFTRTYRGKGQIASNWDRAFPGDFNGDGFSNDLLLWDHDSGDWIVQSWQSFRPTRRSQGRWPKQYDELIVGDFSAGGDLDETILWNRTSGHWVLHSWVNYRLSHVRAGDWPRFYKLGAPGDYDNDGRTDDLFLYAPYSGRWVIHSFHRNQPRAVIAGIWNRGYDVISVGSFSD